jgi:hypothetical protein
MNSTRSQKKALWWVYEATRRTRVHNSTLGLSASRLKVLSHELFDLLPDARQVETSAGSRSPWVIDMDSRRMWHEAVALRTACYLFVAALRMLRDSELQGILRDPIVQHFGAPAIRTRKFKHDESKSEQKWWIIEPVAQALAVAQELSIHPTRVFSSVRRIELDDTALWPNKDIRKFVRHGTAQFCSDHHVGNAGHYFRTEHLLDG